MTGLAHAFTFGRNTAMGCAFFLGVATAPAALGVELFRYQNDQGVTVISYSIPPDLVHKGYTVLSEDGRVIRVVERELSPAEQVERNKRVDAERRDTELLKRYTSPRDVATDRDRRVAEIDQSMARAKQELERSQGRLRRYEREAADAERAGKSPTPATLDNIERTRQQINRYTQEIEAREEEKSQVLEQFKLDEQRVRELLNLPDE